MEISKEKYLLLIIKDKDLTIFINVVVKVIKQTVMTTVYNVTFYGAKYQIMRQLEDIADFPKDKLAESSIYLAKKTFATIRQIFTSAKKIQDWLSRCAYLISSIKQETVKWHTPIGLPVTQPYFKNSKTKSNLLELPDSRKQR